MEKVFTLSITEQFDWESNDKQTTMSFPVTHMLQAIKSGKLKAQRTIAAMDLDFAFNVVSKRDIRNSVINNMTNLRYNEPVLGVWMPDQSVILVDGSHRYMARALNHEQEITYDLLLMPDWMPYATIKGRWPPCEN